MQPAPEKGRESSGYGNSITFKSIFKNHIMKYLSMIDENMVALKALINPSGIAVIKLTDHNAENDSLTYFFNDLSDIDDLILELNKLKKIVEQL